jgi:hypothetical protein
VEAITASSKAALPREPFIAAVARVNEWRGRCLDTFTRTEEAVTECLACLAEVEGRGADVRLPHLVGQRFEALASAIGPGGPFEKEGGTAAAALEQCRAHADARNMLCHATCKVTLDPYGQWTAVFRLVSLRSKRLQRDTLVLTETEAEQLRESITRSGKDLCSRLGQLRSRFRKPATE